MVNNNSEKQVILISRKRVSFDASSEKKVEDLSTTVPFSLDSHKDSKRAASGFVHDDKIERFLKVAQNLNVIITDIAEGHVEIAKDKKFAPQTQHKQTYNQHEIANHSTSTVHQSEIVKPQLRSQQIGTLFPHNSLKTSPSRHEDSVLTYSKQSDDVANDLANFEDCTRTYQNADTPVKRLDAISQTPTVAINQTEETGHDVVGSNAAIQSLNSGNTSNKRKGNGDNHDPCRGYSNHKRHGRKASLGTVEITRLIPTLVSENEEFRCKEYQLKLSEHAPKQSLIES